MVPYAWNDPRERVLQPGDQVFYIIPVIEAVKTGKGKQVTLQPKFEEDGRPVADFRMAGIVQVAPTKSGAMFKVWDVFQRTSVLIPEYCLEYVPPWEVDAELDRIKGPVEVSDREYLIVEHLRDGLDTKRVAARLQLTHPVVKRDLRKFYRRVGIHEDAKSRSDLRESQAVMLLLKGQLKRKIR